MKKRFSFGGAVVVIGIIISALSSCGSAGSSGGGVSNGLGSQDATADVKLQGCSGDPSMGGILTGSVAVFNHSSDTSDYYIEVEIDSSGTNVGTANALAQHVGPGQHALTDLMGTFTGGEPVDCKVTTVQRTASG